jgi:hypothetical protein
VFNLYAKQVSGAQEMKIVVFIILVLSCSPLYGLVSAQTEKEREPDETEVDLPGFRLNGGMVNLVEGDVEYVNGGKPAQRLTANHALDNGDEIHVGPNGRVEVLLNPGHYLRLSGNTRVTFLDLSRVNLKVKISYGACILEALEFADPQPRFWPTRQTIRPFPAPTPNLFPVMRFAPEPSPDLAAELYQPVTFFTPHGDFVTMTGGIFRFDISAHDAAIKVAKGMAVVEGNRVKEGIGASVRNGTAILVELKKGQGDALDVWSRDRAALLVQHNKSLKNTSWSKQLRNNPRSHLKIEEEDWRDRRKKRRTISAIGGVATFVEEGVLVKSEETEWQALTEDAALNYGDKVKTAENSRAEILVYPICALHLGGSTEMVYAEGPDGNTAVKLLKGSAIITYEPGNKDDPLVSFIAPDGRYEILKPGVYRLNILPGPRSEMIVVDGMARVEGREIKVGKKAVFENSGVAIIPIDKKAADAFDIWSRRRPVPSKRRVDVEYRKARLFEFPAHLSGLWFYDPAVGAHTFVPGMLRVKSPYGGHYSVKFAGRWRV